MARNPKGEKKKADSRPRPADGKGRVRRGRPKVCRFCAKRAAWVDYKDVDLLRRFINDRGRIKSRGATGTCAQHQRDVAVAIKTARELAFLPYAVRNLSADPADRRGGGRRGYDRAPRSREAADPEVDGGETATLEGETADAGALNRVAEAPETDVGSVSQLSAHMQTVPAIA